MDAVEEIQVHILNAFVDNGEGGNPAGVVLNADRLTNEQKLKVAQRVGLSETAFVSRSAVADFKLDFFTPARQIAHCGHATIATFSYLSQLGRLNGAFSSKETIDGRREIFLENGLAFMEQRPPRYSPVGDWEARIVKSLGLAARDLLADAPVSIVNTGNSFAIVPVGNEEVLEKIVPHFALITEVSEALGLIGFYVFCRQTGNPLRDANTRMFAPRYGINEEAGTGMAAGPLASYLHDVLRIDKEQFLIQQGWFMHPPSPSLIIVNLTLEQGKITKLMAGGKGVLQSSITVRL